MNRKFFSTLLITFSIFSVVYSQGIHPLGPIYWDIPHSTLAKTLNLYFKMDETLP